MEVLALKGAQFTPRSDTVYVTLSGALSPTLVVPTTGSNGTAIGTATTGQAEQVWLAGWENKGNGTAGVTTYAKSAWLASAGSNSWECDIIVDTQPPWGETFVIAAAVDATHYYYFELKYGRIQIFKRDGSNYYWLTNYSADFTVADGDRIGLRMVENGANLEVSARHNGAISQTIIDTSPLAPVYVEILTNQTSVRVSSLRAGPIGSLT
jgi:hypothetical protein